MQFELRSNGQVEVELIPETEIEHAFVREFLAGAKKGVMVNVTPGHPDTPPAMIVSIPK